MTWIGKQVKLGDSFYCGNTSLKGITGFIIEKKKDIITIEFINPVYNELDECEGNILDFIINN